MLSEAQIIPTVPASDLDRARHFYEDKLGLQLKADVAQVPDGVVYAVGEGGLLVYRTDAPHGENTAAGFLVDDILREMTELRERGITFEDLDLPGLKTENGIADMNGQKGAWFKDSEGNYLALTQM